MACNELLRNAFIQSIALFNEATQHVKLDETIETNELLITL